MNLLRAYRGWMWRRLAFLLPSQGAAILVNLWLALRAPSPLPVRITCICIATILSGLIAYFVFQTLCSARFHRRPNLQEARALRRQMRPYGAFAVTSLLLLGTLMIVPRLFTERQSAGTAVTLPRRAMTRPTAIFVPSPQIPVPEEEERRADPVPVEIGRGEPDIRPVVALEPARLELTERDFQMPREIDVPYLPKQAAVVGAGGSREEGPPTFRPDFDDIRRLTPPAKVLFALLSRPLPDEIDAEGWPAPEGRFEGFLLIGKAAARIPGLRLMLDLPFGRDDSVQASWMAALMPAAEGVDPSETPNWNHWTVAYMRRLSGYTSHATFDLAVSVGVSVDFLGSVEGIPDPGDTKFAPYVGIDAAFWQNGVIGLLLHLGESFPVTLIGSSLGVTELSAQLRIDLTDRISIHGGYRVLLVRYKYDDVASSPPVDLLHQSLTGPVLGIDIRF